MDEFGRFVRLYPVPFRLISDEQQFRKWQWVSARVEKAGNDHRPESHKLFVDTIEIEGDPLSTKDNWKDRRRWIDKLPILSSFGEAEAARITDGTTLVLIRPSRILGLDIKATDAPEWTVDEKEKLLKLQNQGDLFDSTDSKSLKLLRKIPFDFHYRYECETPEGVAVYKHKIVDWEIGALFWNVYRMHKDSWEAPFRAKLEQELPSADLLFLLGTIHRFPDQWLIVSLIYPPKQRPEAERQTALF